MPASLFCTNTLLLTWVGRHHCETGIELCVRLKPGVPKGAVPHKIFDTGNEVLDVWACFRNSQRWHVGCVHTSVGMPAATEWPSAFSVVQTVACLGSFPQTRSIPCAAESLFCSLIATDSLDWWYPANVQQHQGRVIDVSTALGGSGSVKALGCSSMISNQCYWKHPDMLHLSLRAVSPIYTLMPSTGRARCQWTQLWLQFCLFQLVFY